MRESWRHALGRGDRIPQRFHVGRNTLRAGGTNNFDPNLSKSIPVGENRRLEFRWEAMNALNRPQFVQVPQMSVNGAVPGRFLNRDFTDSGIRSMWAKSSSFFEPNRNPPNAQRRPFPPSTRCSPVSVPIPDF